MKESVKNQELGIKALLRIGKEYFRIEENIRYYSPEDFKKAERLFIKKCILNGDCQL